MNVRNYTLQEDLLKVKSDKLQEAPAVKTEDRGNPGEEVTPEEVVKDDYTGNGDQYNLDNVFILEDMEEEESDQITGIQELEGDKIPWVMEVHVGHVDNRLYQMHTQKEWMGVCPVGAKEARQCLAAYITINGVKAYTLCDSGSTPDLMSPDFTWVTKVSTFQLDNPVPIQLGCIGSQSTIVLDAVSPSIWAEYWWKTSILT